MYGTRVLLTIVTAASQVHVHRSDTLCHLEALVRGGARKGCRGDSTTLFGSHLVRIGGFPSLGFVAVSSLAAWQAPFQFRCDQFDQRGQERAVRYRFRHVDVADRRPHLFSIHPLGGCRRLCIRVRAHCGICCI